MAYEITLHTNMVVLKWSLSGETVTEDIPELRNFCAEQTGQE